MSTGTRAFASTARLAEPIRGTVRARILAALWALLIAVLLLVPLPSEQEDYLPGWLTHHIRPWLDDAVHGALFFGFAFLLLGALGSRRFRTPLSFVLAVAYGAFTEWLQPRISGRDGSLVDLLADAAGALAGVAFVALWERARRRSDRGARASRGGWT